MKNLKFISLMLGCLAAACVTFTSCDDDDDTHALTPEEIQTAFAAVRGNYGGSLIYRAINPKNQNDVTDTTAVSWSIQSDSVMTIHDFPVALLGHVVPDSTLRSAIATAAPQDIRCDIGFIRVTPATFLANPNTLTLNLNYGGAAHKVQIAFYVNSYYSYGQVHDRSLDMQIVEAGIYVDGNQRPVNPQAAPFIFTGTKQQ